MLALIFTFLFFIVLHSYGELNNLPFIYNVTFVFADAIGFLLGPLIYFYIQSIYIKGSNIINKSIWHFLPAIGYVLIISIPFLISFLKDEYLFSYLKFIDNNEYLLQIQTVFLFIYLLLSFRALKRFKTLTKENYSNLTDKHISWINYLLYGIFVVILINIFIEVYSILSQGKLSTNNILTTISLIVMVVYLGYHGISQSQILLPNYIQNNLRKKNNAKASVKQPTHHLANADKNEIETLKMQLIQLLEDEQPYLDENLSLKKLAEMIPTTDRKLSALLNFHFNTNFYDFINAYRVKEIQTRLGKQEFNKYTILALAFDSGFNSKSSFNRIFKKETGLSPSAYKKQLLNKK
ncbi:helix-turn-helix domain-containing protein [uncultured Aquimarina sp.]|uniref:helix-turn-helix domain-containing protein n=1 Tax=uncultured Aquimarina sp. TaxID=575652 RepID=UPI002619DE73|nr:helix-turn-helix domain-containing protein [uncultured Aquimarina sp.]